MSRYLMTHSLLSSWLYMLRENPYEDAENAADPMAEFLLTLKREPTPTTEAMQRGIEFEDLVTAILRGTDDPNAKYHDAAGKVADIIRGATLQCRSRKEVTVDGLTLVLYGRLDALKGGTIYDIKFSRGYERGKYFDSTQHPTYFETVPEVQRFVYLVSNGTELWTETYRRDETRSIFPVISDFFAWLRAQGLYDIYLDKWAAL